MAQFKFKITDQDASGCISSFTLFLGDDDRVMKVRAYRDAATNLEWWCEIYEVTLFFDIHSEKERMQFPYGVWTETVLEFFVEKFFNERIDKEQNASKIAFLKDVMDKAPLKMLSDVEIAF